MGNNYFISVDANDIGKKIENLILNEKKEELSAFSNTVSGNITDIAKCIEASGSEVIMAGGDNILAVIDSKKTDMVLRKISEINACESVIFSVGLGNSMTNSYLALKYAKVTKDFAIMYDGTDFKQIFKGDKL